MGYRGVCLCDGPRRKIFLVHNLVLLAFVGPAPLGADCRHLDGDKDNNHLENLQYGTRKENCADTMRHGRTTRGEKSGTAKLTEAVVRQIRELYRMGVPRKKIAEDLAVNWWTLRDVVTRKTWNHLSD